MSLTLASVVFNGSDNRDDRARAVAVDGDGNIFVTGESYSGTNFDYCTIKYNNDLSVMLASATYHGSINGWERAYGLAIDNTGNIIVTGQNWNGLNLDYCTIKYNNDLSVILASAVYDNSGADNAYAVALDTDGNIFVTGQSWGGSSYDYCTVKYNSDLSAVLASTTYDAPAGDWDSAKAIDVDNDGNIFVTGTCSDGVIFYCYTVKYNNDLSLVLGSVTYNCPVPGDDSGMGLTIDSGGNIIVAGYSSNGVNNDYFNFIYNNDLSVILASAVYDSSGADNAYAVTLDANGNIFTTGSSWSGGGNDYFTIKYNGSPMISSVSPTDGNHGETLVFTINGLNFFSGAKVDFSGEGIIVNSVNFINSTQIEVNITIVRGAFLGARDITVTNTDDVSATLSAAFEVRGLLSGDDDEIDEVKIQGGENGYVSFSKGDDVTIYFKTSDPGEIKLKVYTLRGQLAWEETKETDGEEDFIIWDGKNTEGTVVASGVYVILIDGPGINTTNKIAIIK